MTTNTQFPLFVELSEEGRIQAQALLDRFKEQMKKIANETLGELYCDILPHIESDSWSNFRNALMSGFRNYNNRLIQGEYDFRSIREEIYRQFKAEIIKDLDQDNLKRIAELEDQLKRMREMR